MIKVLIVEDHPLLVEGLLNSFAKAEDVEVVATAGTGADCLKKIKSCSTDIILMDLRLPDIQGAELAKEILKLYPETKIIVLTTHQQRFYIQTMIETGVKGYLLKSVNFDEILKAIHTVNEGGIYFCKDVMQQLRDDEQNQIFITKRELEVLKLIAAGHTNQEIADKLFISPLTVDSHRKNLILKFDAKNTASMISIAVAQGYL